MPDNKDNDHKMEIVPAAGAEFGLLARDAMTSALEVIENNLSDPNFSVLTLPRVRVAGGGAVNFRYDTASGEETAKRLTGLMTAYRSTRIYWKSKTAGKRPPDCTSINGFIGVGDPGGNCRECPYARFGSAINQDGSRGAGQACKDIKQVLFLLGGELLPHLLNVPPTSLKAFNTYTLGLTSRGINYWAAITELSLERAENDGGNPYARIQFRKVTQLTPPEQQILRPYHLKMKDLLTPAVIDASAYDDDGPAPPQRPLFTPPAPPAPTARFEPAPPPPENEDIPF